MKINSFIIQFHVNRVLRIGLYKYIKNMFSKFSIIIKYSLNLLLFHALENSTFKNVSCMVHKMWKE
jgi:hypothetical protein